ncbi:MAG: hypothetical protein JWO75_390 [Actinomycetia bacterium]|nr:hypothetical protein [Actinomycetes bacterium]
MVVLGFLVQGKSDLVRATGRTTAVVDACAGGRSIVCQVHWIVDGRMYVGQFGIVNTGNPPYGLTDVTGADFDNAITRDLRIDQVIGWVQ